MKKLVKGEREVALLEIDTEGFDYDVLKQYPFDQVRTHRVIYEASHLHVSSVIAAAELLRSHGFANVLGGLGKVQVAMWQHMTYTPSSSAEFVPPPIPVPNRTRRSKGRGAGQSRAKPETAR